MEEGKRDHVAEGGVGLHDALELLPRRGGVGTGMFRLSGLTAQSRCAGIAKIRIQNGKHDDHVLIIAQRPE